MNNIFKQSLLVIGLFLVSLSAMAQSKMTISGLPALPYDRHCTVIEVEFEDIPRLQPEPDKAAWLF